MSNKFFHKALSNRVVIANHRSWWQTNRNSLKWLLLGFISTVTVIITVLWYFYDEPLVSPLSGVTSFQFLGGESIEAPFFDEKKIVYAFLPYWNINKVVIQPEITHLAYFSLGIGADGQIQTVTQEQTAEPGYAKLGSDQLMEHANQVGRNKGTIEIVLTQFDNKTIETFLASPSAHQATLASLDAILLAYPINGINVDIEYVGEASPTLRRQYVDFIKNLRRHLSEKYKNPIHLSIDVYASAAAKPQLWDVAALAPHIDHFVIMAYDFYRRSSTTAGPTAPLFGANEYWDSDINQYIKNFLAITSREKLILGLPFYGYGWQTTSRDSQATTYPNTGSTYSYERIESILAKRQELKVTEHWHDTALAPYLTYEENEETYVVYYENARSIAYKLEYAKQLDLAGIAIWAIGYEGATRELWEPIKNARR